MTRPHKAQHERTDHGDPMQERNYRQQDFWMSRDT
jgi:hypothetical protein